MINSRKKQKGFTLVELLIVIAIIAVLAAVVTPVALNSIAQSKATAIIAEARSIQTADLTYYVSNDSYAAKIEDLSAYIDVSNSRNAVYTIADRELTITVNEARVFALLDEDDFFVQDDGLTVVLASKNE